MLKILRRTLSLLLVLAVVLPVLSCGAPQISDGAISFVDDLGREVYLEEKPSRVAVLFSSFAEIWTLAGGEVKISVGESVERGICDTGVTLVDSGAGKTVNSELLVSSGADLVICSADIAGHLELLPTLTAAKIPTAYFRVESLEDYLSTLKVFTEITERPDLYALYGEAVKEAAEKLISEAPSDKATYLFLRAGATVVKAKASDEHFVCSMLGRLGATNIADSAPIIVDGLSLEEILKQNPDYIFISTMGDEAAAIANVTSLFEKREWEALDAVEAGRYYFLPKDKFQYKPNHKWAEAYAYLRDILYE